MTVVRRGAAASEEHPETVARPVKKKVVKKKVVKARTKHRTGRTDAVAPGRPPPPALAPAVPRGRAAPDAPPRPWSGDDGRGTGTEAVALAPAPAVRPPPPAPSVTVVPAPTDWVSRLLVEPDANGPRMRVAVVWFALLVPAVWFGSAATAALFGLVAAVAALQARQAWYRIGYWSSRGLAALAALVLPWLAVAEPRAAGLGLVALPLVALGVSALVRRRRRRLSVVAATGVTLRCAVPAGVAAVGMVIVTQSGLSSALVLVALICAYDVGSFLFGAESRSPATGIVGGIICTIAMMAPIWALQLPPFNGRTEAFVFAGFVAVCAPLSQLVGSLALPSAATWVPALRRLDAYILTAPLWGWTMAGYLS